MEGGYRLLLLMATKRLIETMSGYMKEKLAALTAPMANAYRNAVVFNKNGKLSRDLPP